MEAFQFLPKTAAVAAWFAQHGATLHDLPSYRNQVAAVRREIQDASRDLGNLREFGLHAEAGEFDLAVRAAWILVDAMERRITQLGVQPVAVAADAVSWATQMVEIYGDGVLEAGFLA